MTVRPLLLQPSNLSPLDVLCYLFFGMETNEQQNTITIWNVLNSISALAMVSLLIISLAYNSRILLIIFS